MFGKKIIQNKVEIKNTRKIPTFRSESKTETTPDIAMIGKNVNRLKNSKCVVHDFIGSDHLPLLFELTNTFLPKHKKYLFPEKYLKNSIL